MDSNAAELNQLLPTIMRDPDSPPVLLIVFNRPEHTKKCIDAIAKVSPCKLFIASDGPRAGNSVDRIRCEQVQRVLDGISWPCEVSKLNRTQNLGCQHAVSSAIDWFFSHVDRGIILEDDCIADPSFFSFCGQMLDRYADDERIGVVTGNNFQRGVKRGEASYYFSKYNHCWGWATWRRAWQHFDFDMSESDKSDQEIIFQFACVPGELKYWSEIFDRVRCGDINTWDYRWTRAVWSRRYLTVTPNVNLVENVGFDPSATHTRKKLRGVRNQAVSNNEGILESPLVRQCMEADCLVARDHYGIKRKRIASIMQSTKRFFSR